MDITWPGSMDMDINNLECFYFISPALFIKIVDTFEHKYNHIEIYFYVSTLFPLRASRSYRSGFVVFRSQYMNTVSRTTPRSYGNLDP